MSVEAERWCASAKRSTRSATALPSPECGGDCWTRNQSKRNCSTTADVASLSTPTPGNAFPLAASTFASITSNLDVCDGSASAIVVPAAGSLPYCEKSPRTRIGKSVVSSSNVPCSARSELAAVWSVVSQRRPRPTNGTAFALEARNETLLDLPGLFNCPRRPLTLPAANVADSSSAPCVARSVPAVDSAARLWVIRPCGSEPADLATRTALWEPLGTHCSPVHLSTRTGVSA